MNAARAIADMQHGLPFNGDESLGYTIARAQAVSIAEQHDKRAAALLEALAMLLDQCERVGMTTRDDEPYLQAARAAIAAATNGESA